MARSSHDLTLFVGRTAECDIAIADESVSRQHLRIINILGDCFLEDLNSANGTLVNNRLTKKCPLNDGDSITIGQHEIKYDAAQHKLLPDDEFDRMRIMLIKQLGEPDRVPTAEEQPKIPTLVLSVTYLLWPLQTQPTTLSRWKTLIGILKQALNQNQ